MNQQNENLLKEFLEFNGGQNDQRKSFGNATEIGISRIQIRMVRVSFMQKENLCRSFPVRP